MKLGRFFISIQKLFVLEKIFRMSNLMCHQMPSIKKYILLNNLGSKPINENVILQKKKIAT